MTGVRFFRISRAFVIGLIANGNSISCSQRWGYGGGSRLRNRTQFLSLQQQVGPRGKIIGVRLLTGPFGGTIEMASRKPWQSLENHLTLIQFNESLGKREPDSKTPFGMISA